MQSVTIDHIERRAHDRDFIATILLDAVLDSESNKKDRFSAQNWLRGPLAGAMFLLLDINQRAALERLEQRWEKLKEQNHVALH